MSYTFSQLEKDNQFIELQQKSISNLMKLIYSTTADFNLLNTFISNWITYINDNPTVDPSGNLLYILTNTVPPPNSSSYYTGSGIYDIISTGKYYSTIFTDTIYPFTFIQYITNLQSNDTSYTAIVQFFNQLIAL